MGRLAEKVIKYSLVALDTAIFIYHFEKNKKYFELTKDIFNYLDENKDFCAVTSIITLIETLVKPIKDSRNDLANEYALKLLYDDKLTTRMVDGEIAKKTAEIRAKYGIKTLSIPTSKY